MKQSFVSVGLAVAMLYAIGCERNIFVKKESEQTYFPTQQEAANKGEERSSRRAALEERNHAWSPGTNH